MKYPIETETFVETFVNIFIKPVEEIENYENLARAFTELLNDTYNQGVKDGKLIV